MPTMIPCPACKKRISVEAEACPKCGQPVTEEIRAAAVKKLKHGKLGCLTILGILAIVALIDVSNRPKVDKSIHDNTPVSTAPRAAGNAPRQPQPESDNLPANSFVNPLNGQVQTYVPSTTPQPIDKNNQKEKTEKEYLKEFEAKAYKGDYQAQRNLAWLYSTSKDPFISNKILGCSWYKLILLSGSQKIGDGDIGNVQTFCGKLTPEQQVVTEGQALRLYGEIYQK